MTCFRTDRKSRLIHAIREYRSLKDEPKGFGRPDFRDLVVRARIPARGEREKTMVPVWGNVHLRPTAGVKKFIDANAEWPTVFQLPTYAPDLNPTEGIRAPVKRDLGNLAAANRAGRRNPRRDGWPGLKSSISSAASGVVRGLDRDSGV